MEKIKSRENKNIAYIDFIEIYFIQTIICNMQKYFGKRYLVNQESKMLLFVL